MPDLTPSAPVFRRGAYAFQTYASVLPYDEVLVGTVTATPTFPALTVAYTLVSGSHTNVKTDQLIVFYDTGGARKGSLRVAFGTPTSVSLPIEEVSAGTVNIASGDTFKVFDAYEIRTKLVSATAALNKDSRIALGTNLSDPPPVANCGGLWAGFVDAGQTYATVTFDASISFTVDPDSSGTLTYLWSVADGSIVVGSTTTAQISVHFPVGFRHVTLTVTDSSNSKSTTRRVPVWVHDHSTYEPLSVIINTLTHPVGQGWSGSFELPAGDQSSLDNLPDGALLVLWEVETYNGTADSFGSEIANRSHIKAALYLVRDSIHIDPDNSVVTFDAVSPLSILELTAALPQLAVRTNSPASWSQVRGLTLNRVLWYIAYFHASLLTYFDFRWVDGSDLAYARIAVEGTSLAEQLRDVANSINVNVTCDSLGAIRLIRDPNYLSSTDRNSRTVAYDFTTADIIEDEFSREHRGTTKTVRGEGITAGTTTSTLKQVFSNAPGNAPSWMGIGSDTLAKQIVSTQAQLNARTGLHFARLNGLYNGVFVPKGMQMRLPDGYMVIDPSYRDFVTVTLPTSSNRRGVSFDDTERWTVESVAITYDAERGTKEVVVTLDHETIGADGTTYIPPQESNNGLPSYPPIETQFPGLGVDTGALGGGGTGNIALFLSDGTLAMTANFSNPAVSGGPSWGTVDLTALTNWNGSALLGFVVDAYSPLYIGTGSTVNGWIATDVQVQRITDIFSVSGGVALGSPFSFPFTVVNNVFLHAERGTQNFVAVSAGLVNDGQYVWYTTDGTNWSGGRVSTHYGYTGGTPPPMPLHVSPHTAGVIQSQWYTNSVSFPTIATDSGAVSSDYGATFSNDASPDLSGSKGLSLDIHIPFANTAEDTVYWMSSQNANGNLGQDFRLYKSVGATQTDISPTVSPGGVENTYGPTAHYAVTTLDANASEVLLVGQNVDSEFTLKWGIWRSHNAGSSWITIVDPDSTVVYRAGNFGGNANQFYLWGINGAIAFCSDGSTIDSRVGDLVSTATVLNICGGG